MIPILEKNIIEYKKEKNDKIFIKIDFNEIVSQLSRSKFITDEYYMIYPLIIPALKTSLDKKYSFNNETNEIELYKKDIFDFSLFDEELINNINISIKKEIEKDLGKSVEDYIREKNNNKQEELYQYQESKIASILLKLLVNKFGNENAQYLLNSDAQLVSYDLSRNNIEHIKNPVIELNINRHLDYDQERKINNSLYNSIMKSKFVFKIDFIESNNNSKVIIRSNNTGKKILIDMTLEATKQYFNNPRYKEPNKDDLTIFLGRVNDGNGNDCDILKLKSNGNILLMIKDDQYITLDKLKDINIDLFIQVENALFQTNQLNHSKSKRTGLKI